MLILTAPLLILYVSNTPAYKENKILSTLVSAATGAFELILCERHQLQANI